MIAIIGTADMPSTEIIQMVNRAVQAWRHTVYAVQYNLFDVPAACYDPEEIAYLFKTYIRECDLKCIRIRRSLRLTAHKRSMWSRIDQWDYG